MKTLAKLFEQNRAWSESVRQQDPEFFARLSRQQSPQYLWIGCSDSRVPANQIVGLMPGEVFVHRNIANLVVHSDLNCLSVVQFAVDVLKVRHIIVCGHYGCGGVTAAQRDERHGLVDDWLRHVQDVERKHLSALADIRNGVERVDRLCELNVLDQALNVCRTTTVMGAWERRQKLSVHGWIYGLHDGLLRDLGFCATRSGEVLPLYQNAIRKLGSGETRRDSDSRLSTLNPSTLN